MTYLLDGVESTAKPGDKVVVQPGQVHTFWSGSDQDLLMQATTTGGASGAGFDDSLWAYSPLSLARVDERGLTAATATQRAQLLCVSTTSLGFNL